MPIMSLKVPAALDARVAAAARQRRLTKSALGEGCFLELAGDLVGCVEGPGDLSHNPKRMRGYGG